MIVRFVRSLAQDSRMPGDFTDQDQSLKTRQIKVIGDFAITYWVDEPVKAVMAVSVQLADR